MLAVQHAVDVEDYSGVLQDEVAYCTATGLVVFACFALELFDVDHDCVAEVLAFDLVQLQVFGGYGCYFNFSFVVHFVSSMI